ncbi:hypothetical protein N9189_02705 [Pirellulaceae bacterium]|nr:hypothetical protein [Pirellulaceae bacterium]
MMSKANKTLPVVTITWFDSLKSQRHDPNNIKTFAQTAKYSLNSRSLVKDGCVVRVVLNRNSAIAFAVGTAMVVFGTPEAEIF